MSTKRRFYITTAIPCLRQTRPREAPR